MKRLLLIFIPVFRLSVLCGQDTLAHEWRSLPPEEFREELKYTYSSIIIDVREPFEFRGKRIKGAVNIPSSFRSELMWDTIIKERPIFLYCTTDYRSENVAERMIKYGFTRVASLDGGIVAWRRKGYPLVRRR